MSDGMHSYFDKAQPISNLNPTAASYIPEKEQTDILPPPLVVRPKDRTEEQIPKTSVKTNRQVRIVSDRLFGNIHDTQPVTSAKGFTRKQIKETKSHKGSSFATNVIEIEEKAKSAWTEKKESSFPISTYQGCLFCNKSGHSF